MQLKENFQLCFATVTGQGLLFKNKIFTNKTMVKYGWFEKAGKNGSWEIPVLYCPIDSVHIYLFDIETCEVATAITPIVTYPAPLIHAYHDAISNLKIHLKHNKSTNKRHPTY
ncbi:hypothetical protein [Paenibacillus sp. LPE1-1-1.1]|uniref:hypothetical protein n=1 Tax=Paenibacillus sp. LPE1-1-1.1 TaxID=3135230 RepID=UPI00342ED5CD